MSVLALLLTVKRRLLIVALSEVGPLRQGWRIEGPHKDLTALESAQIISSCRSWP